jgi:O-antigen/teichoic acid export membrane protein
VAGTSIGRGFAFLAGILVARHLQKELYGEYELLKTTILAMATLSNFGLGYVSTKYIAEFKTRSPEKIRAFISFVNWFTILLSSVAASVVFIFAGLISETWFNAPQLTDFFRAFSVLIIFNALTVTQSGVLAGLGLFRTIAKLNSIVGMVTFVATVGLTYLYGVWGSMLGLACTQIIAFTLNARAISSAVGTYVHGGRWQRDMHRETLIAAFPIALKESVYSASTWLVSFMLISYASIGEVGVYAASAQWGGFVLMIPGMLKNVILSHLASTNQEEKKFDSIVKLTVSINFVFTALPAVAIIIFSDVIQRLYGLSYVGLSRLVIIASIISIISSCGGVYIQSFIALGKNWSAFVISICREIGIIIIGLIFLTNLNVSGAQSIALAALTANLAYLVSAVIFYKSYRRKNETTSLHY